MKTIQLYKGELFSSKQVFTEVLTIPANGCTTAEMRQYIKIMDVLEKAEDSFELEDADFDRLKNLFSSNRFRIAHKDLVAIEDTLNG